MLHVHFNGPANIVGILFDQCLDLPNFQIGTEDLFIGIFFQVHDHAGPDLRLFDLLDRVAVYAGAFPFNTHFFAIFLGLNRNFLRHHKGRVETNTELSDDGYIFRRVLFRVQILFELVRAGFCNDAQVILRLGFIHTDTIVDNGDGAVFFVQLHTDFKIISGHADILISQGQIAQFVDGVRCVGDDLTEKNLFIGINGVDHKIQQSLRFCFELFFCHGINPSKNNI